MFSTFVNPFTDGAAANEQSEPEKHTPPNRPRTYNEALISYLERHPSTTEEDIEIIKKEGGDLECLFLWGASEQDIADAEIIAKGPSVTNLNNNPISTNNPKYNKNNNPSSSSDRPDAPETAGEAPSPQPKYQKFVIPNENNANNNNNNNSNDSNSNSNDSNSRSAPGAPSAAAPSVAKAKFVIPSETAVAQAVTVMDDAVQV